MNADAGIQTIVVVCGNFGEFKNYLASLKVSYNYAKGYAYHGGIRYKNCGDAQFLRGLKNWKPVFYGTWERRNDIDMIMDLYQMDACRYPDFSVEEVKAAVEKYGPDWQKLMEKKS